MVSRGRWREAVRQLHATNNFPEFTGRICPGAVRSLLRAGHQHASGDHQADRKDHHRPRFRRGLHRARTASARGPASASPSSVPAPPDWPRRNNWRAPATTSRSSRRPTASAACCATASRISRWRSTSSTAVWSRCSAEGVRFRTGAHVGVNIAVEDLRREHHALLLAGGSEQPRDLRVPGRELNGIHFAMEFLPQQNRRNEGDEVPAAQSDSRRRQARGDHRRRRHRRRLPGHLPPPGRALGDAVRTAAQAARRAVALDAVAALAHAIAHRGRARRRRHARLERLHRAVHRRRRRQREAASRGAGGCQAAGDSRHGIHHGGRPGAAGHGIPRARYAAA